jgi:hypothetical protein
MEFPMRKTLFTLLTLMILAATAACVPNPEVKSTNAPLLASPTATNTPQPIVQSTKPANALDMQQAEPSTPAGAPPFPIEPIQAYLAQQINVPVEQITLTDYREVEWRDSCLGVHKPKEMCADVITPGYILIFSANGVDYQVNTNATGLAYRTAETYLVLPTDSGIK